MPVSTKSSRRLQERLIFVTSVVVHQRDELMSTWVAVFDLLLVSDYQTLSHTMSQYKLLFIRLNGVSSSHCYKWAERYSYNQFSIDDCLSTLAGHFFSFVTKSVDNTVT